MSWRQLRNLLLLALGAFVAYSWYTKRPTVSGVVDSITQPLMGSKAAVKGSERNRVMATAVPSLQEQVEAPLGTIRERMTYSEVRALLGSPERIEEVQEDGRIRVRWIYGRVRRMVVFEDGRVLSITVM
ncbi:MAG: hypothetical protein ABR576_16610 [Thermoanaerobaculia bacterium]